MRTSRFMAMAAGVAGLIAAAAPANAGEPVQTFGKKSAQQAPEPAESRPASEQQVLPAEPVDTPGECSAKSGSPAIPSSELMPGRPDQAAGAVAPGGKSKAKSVASAKHKAHRPDRVAQAAARAKAGPAAVPMASAVSVGKGKAVKVGDAKAPAVAPVKVEPKVVAVPKAAPPKSATHKAAVPKATVAPKAATSNASAAKAAAVRR
ncbi:MAG: hypothetical protein AMXMBFR58_11050 [Phycisphaerae bacterium]